MITPPETTNPSTAPAESASRAAFWSGNILILG